MDLPCLQYNVVVLVGVKLFNFKLWIIFAGRDLFRSLLHLRVGLSGWRLSVSNWRPSTLLGADCVIGESKVPLMFMNLGVRNSFLVVSNLSKISICNLDFFDEAKATSVINSPRISSSSNGEDSSLEGILTRCWRISRLAEAVIAIRFPCYIPLSLWQEVVGRIRCWCRYGMIMIGRPSLCTRIIWMEVHLILKNVETIDKINDPGRRNVTI